ncbi:Band 4.1-like 2 [Oopsacas minuta]|uniref:Band 4.1-like 2 n=1 Tax=Oopsacas minuta TaxID=111878 RepID=A0AAV7K6F0_9METZ|nr:Band 4.1-like 2 [Oopsacas minuta]
MSFKSRSDILSNQSLKTQIKCRIDYYEGQEYTTQVDYDAKGQDLLRRVFMFLGIEECDFFGLLTVTNELSQWIEPNKLLRKQIDFNKKANDKVYVFTLKVKLFPPDSRQIFNEITRYYLVLQLRQDVFSGQLPCSFASAVYLASLIAQAEIGDFNEEEHPNTDYLEKLSLLQNQDSTILGYVRTLHQEQKTLTPAETDELFLDRATRLQYYGIHFSMVQSGGPPLLVGISSKGITTYTGEWPNFIKLHEIPWLRISRIEYRKNKLLIHLVPILSRLHSDGDGHRDIIVFKLENKRIAKQVWKICIEHHGFFRCSKTMLPPKKLSFLKRGSKFRFTGRTYQYLVRQGSKRWEEDSILSKRQNSLQRFRIQGNNHMASILSRN